LIHSPAHDDAVEAGAPARVLGKLPVTPAPPVAPANSAISSPATPLAVTAPLAAPALPTPVAVAAPPAPPPAADHPVPPGSIPDDMPAEKPAEAANHSWMSKVPILNRVVGN